MKDYQIVLVATVGVLALIIVSSGTIGGGIKNIFSGNESGQAEQTVALETEQASIDENLETATEPVPAPSEIATPPTAKPTPTPATTPPPALPTVQPMGQKPPTSPAPVTTPTVIPAPKSTFVQIDSIEVVPNNDADIQDVRKRISKICDALKQYDFDLLFSYLTAASKEERADLPEIARSLNKPITECAPEYVVRADDYIISTVRFVYELTYRETENWVFVKVNGVWLLDVSSSRPDFGELLEKGELDLKVESITITPTRPTINDDVIFTVSFLYEGNMPSDDYTLSVVLIVGNKTHNFFQFSNGSLPMLEPGDRLLWKFGPEDEAMQSLLTIPGQKTISVAIIGTDHQSKDVNPADNRLEKTFTID